MSNAWIIYPLVGDNSSKGGLIPDDTASTAVKQSEVASVYKLSLKDESAYH